MSDIINVYIGMGRMEGEGDWSYLYPKPNTLFKHLRDDRNSENSQDSFLYCPAVSNKFKNTLVFENTLKAKYEYDFRDGQKLVTPITDQFLAFETFHDPSIKTGPTIKFSLNYTIFADESLYAYFTPPFFHKPKYLRYGATIPGEFDIGKWFRPYLFEVQMWNNYGIFEIEEEPIFYVELKTDKKIKFHYFNITPNLLDYAKSSVQTTTMFGIGQSLSERYERFSRIGMREKVLTEIKKNLIEE